ncbi:MAG: cytochrome c family protein [Alphaproteobacteria bacterium]|nr:MAG: cytochrome c family protein [Alphaproteobacteria bacterium]
MVISTVSSSLFHEGEGHGEGHAKPAFTIEVASEDTGAAEVEEKAVPLAVLLASADPAKGERQFAKCKSCHTADAGKKDGTGPHLYGVLGRAVAGVEGFGYSDDLHAVGGDWTWEKMDHWLDSPKAMAKGTKMAFAGLKKADQRADLLAYLNSMSDNPLPLPEVADEPAAEEAAPAEAEEHSGR